MSAAEDCAICLSELAAGEASTSCPACHARYHSDCWRDNGGCAVYGCAQVPVQGGRSALEVPAAYWGREDKSCPRCGATILALAVRCRHCGASVSERPEEKAAYDQRLRRERRSPLLRRLAVLNMVSAILPGLALVAGFGGLLLYTRFRTEIRRLPGTYEGLYRLSIALGFVHSALLLIALAIFAVKDAAS